MKAHVLMNVRRQRGFSLVELMVAMTLSLLLLAGALSILYSSKITYNENDRVARLQEAGRTVVEMMLRDTRPAGFLGCSRPVNGDEFGNGLNNNLTLLWNFAQPVYGFEATGAATWLPALDPMVKKAVDYSDVLVLRTTRQGQPVFRTNTPVTDTAAVIQVDTDSGVTLPANTPMIIADCEGSAVFMATSYTPVGTTGTIAHDAAGAGVDGNTSANLARGFVLGAQVMPVETVIYYVGDSGSGPALWQKVGAAEPQELVEGVENLQVRYGIDTDNNLQADKYVTADLVTAAQWNQVISVELAVLVRSPLETGSDRDNRKYDLLGKSFGPFNDRRQRSVFTTTVVLRNRTS
jgi:type IV pilus assembly protein PilW